MSEEWQTASSGGVGKFVRWNEEPKDDKQAEKTVFVGLKIQGIYKEKVENFGQNNSNVYKIETEEHGTLAVWGFTVIDDKMTEVPVGSEIILECLGEVPSKTGGKSYFGFKDVQFRPAPFQTASTETEEESIEDRELPPV